MYTVYRVTNLINGNYYIGVHKTSNPLDSYFGSGVRINASLKKYGKENFKKEVLFDYPTAEEAYKKEIELIDLKDPFCINISQGGIVNYERPLPDSAKEKLRAINQGKTHSEEAKKRMSQIRTGKKHSDETKRKIGMKVPTEEELKAHRERGKLRTGWKHSEETKRKIGEEVKKVRYSNPTVKGADGLVADLNE